MLETASVPLNLLFIITTGFTYLAFSRSITPEKFAFRKTFSLLAGILILVQGFLAFSGFYLVYELSFPPRFMLTAPVLIVFSISLLFFQKGRKKLTYFSVKKLTWLSFVRVPVEMTLHSLFILGVVPENMTYEGTNFDILAGFTAPFMAWFVFQNFEARKKWLILWYMISLGLLMNIGITAALSVPGPMQVLNEGSPNTGILYFPFVLLPAFVFPVVFFAHVSCLYQLLNRNSDI